GWIGEGSAADPGEPPPITAVPFMSHTTVCPVKPLRQRMSLRASALKSWLAAKAAATKPVATKLAQHASVLRSRRSPVLEFELIVSSHLSCCREWSRQAASRKRPHRLAATASSIRTAAPALGPPMGRGAGPRTAADDARARHPPLPHPPAARDPPEEVPPTLAA